MRGRLRAHGEGDPSTSQAYKNAIAALFAVSYAVKFMVKKGSTGVDYGVMPLEGLWWTEGSEPFRLDQRDTWKWAAMIMQPEFVTAPLVRGAQEQVLKKKGLPDVDQLEFQAFQEGRAAQILHIGPYSEEGPTLEKLHTFIAEQGGTPHGKHHEIYLSDPGKTAPEKLKTIVRQPFV